jgi:hypothetical protein
MPSDPLVEYVVMEEAGWLGSKLEISAGRSSRCLHACGEETKGE